MPFCSNCGGEISKNAHFCEKCGMKIDKDENYLGQPIRVQDSDSFDDDLSRKLTISRGITKKITEFFILNFLLDIITIGIVYYVKYISLNGITPGTSIWYEYKLASVYELWFIIFVNCIIQFFIYYFIINSGLKFNSFKQLLFQVSTPTFHLIALIIIFLFMSTYTNIWSGIIYAMIDAGVIIGVFNIALRSLVFKHSELSLLKQINTIHH